VKRGDLHGFVNEQAADARMLLVSSPARHDEFFRALAALAVPHDREAVLKVCTLYRQEIVG
jgi:hypothetical protein